jgi:hypothetical protein
LIAPKSVESLPGTLKVLKLPAAARRKLGKLGEFELPSTVPALLIAPTCVEELPGGSKVVMLPAASLKNPCGGPLDSEE